jgi:hypothetical protein
MAQFLLFCFAGRISAMYGKQVMRALSRLRNPFDILEGEIMKRKEIVQLVILLIGIILILLAIVLQPESDSGNVTISINTILLSIGCSILAVVIINFFEYHITLPERKTYQYINDWKLVSIFETRAKMNEETNRLLETVSELDIAAFGCKGLLNFKGELIKKRMGNGLKVRFLIPKNDTAYIAQREKDEDATEGDIKESLDNLILWVKQTKKELNLPLGNVVIKEYECLPIESIMRIDNFLFTGPFMIKKMSQLTMAYQYKKGGKGYDYYKKYFDNIWNDEAITREII